MRLKSSALERFWDKVERGSSDECWEWTAARSHGYGVLGIEGRNVLAHRISWHIAHDQDPDLVLHKCDNPGCVNPEHLYSGGKSENMIDAARRQGVNATMSMNDVREARQRYANEEVTYAELATEYGVTPAVMGKAVRGNTWS